MSPVIIGREGSDQSVIMVSSEGGRGKNFQNWVSPDMWMPPLQKFTTVIAELRRECFELPEGAMDSAIESIILKTAEDLMMWLCSLIEQWFVVPRQFCWLYCFGHFLMPIFRHFGRPFSPGAT